MKKYNTSERLQQIMRSRNLKQIDILRLCEPIAKKLGIKIGRNDISQYVSGKVIPGQDKLTVLSMALGVSEVWLMGYDVDMQQTLDSEFYRENITVSHHEKAVISAYRDHPEMQNAVDKLLGIEHEETDITKDMIETVRTRASAGKNPTGVK